MKTVFDVFPSPRSQNRFLIEPWLNISHPWGFSYSEKVGKSCTNNGLFFVGPACDQLKAENKLYCIYYSLKKYNTYQVHIIHQYLTYKNRQKKDGDLFWQGKIKSPGEFKSLFNDQNLTASRFSPTKILVNSSFFSSITDFHSTRL